MKLQLLVPSHIDSATFDELLPIIEMYLDDLGSSATIKDEFERWQMKWRTHEPREECPRNAIDSLHDSLKDFYQNINILLHLFATLPVTSASAERSFSCLKRLKPHLRNKMGEDRRSGHDGDQSHCITICICSESDRQTFRINA